MKNEKLTFNSREEFREYTTKVLSEELKTILLEADEPEDEIVTKENLTPEQIEIIKSGLDRGRNISPEIINDAFKLLSDADARKILDAEKKGKTVIFSGIENTIRLKQGAEEKPSIESAKELAKKEKKTASDLEGLQRAFLSGDVGGGIVWGQKGFQKRLSTIMDSPLMRNLFGGETIKVTTPSSFQYVTASDVKELDAWKKATENIIKYNEANPDKDPIPLPKSPDLLKKISFTLTTKPIELLLPKLGVYAAGTELTDTSGRRVVPAFVAGARTERKPAVAPSVAGEIPSEIRYRPLVPDISGVPELVREKGIRELTKAAVAVAKGLLDNGISRNDHNREITIKKDGQEEGVELLKNLGPFELIDLVMTRPSILNSKYKSFDDYLEKSKYDDATIAAFADYEPTRIFEIGDVMKFTKKPEVAPVAVSPEEEELRKRYTQEDVAKALGISRSLVSEIEDLAFRKVDKLRNLAFNKVVKSKQLKVADLVTDFMVENDEALSFPEDMSDEEIGEVNEQMFREFLKFMIDKGFVGQYLPDLIADVFTKISAFGFKKGKTFTDPRKTIKDIMLNVEETSTYLEDFEGVASAIQRDIDALKKQKPGKLPGEKELRDQELAVLNAKKDSLLILGTLLSNSKIVEVITTEYDAVKDLYENSLEAAAAIKNAYNQLEVEAEEGFFDEDPSLIDYKFDLTEADYRERLSDAILSYISSGEQGLYGLREKISADLVKSVLKPKSDDEAWERWVRSNREEKRSKEIERREAGDLGIVELRRRRAQQKAQQEAQKKAAETAKSIMTNLLKK